MLFDGALLRWGLEQGRFVCRYSGINIHTSNTTVRAALQLIRPRCGTVLPITEYYDSSKLTILKGSGCGRHCFRLSPNILTHCMLLEGLDEVEPAELSN
jgi:hypothetical protein